MAQRRFYVHPERCDVIFMEWDTAEAGWMPAIHAMEEWLMGRNRIYSPQDNPSLLITMPGHTVWPRLTQIEYPDIRGTLAAPWIGQYMEGIHEAEIDENDALFALHDVDQPPPILSRSQLDTVERISRPRLHTPINQMEVALAASRSVPRPRQRPRNPPPSFPAHLVDSVLAAAEAEGKTCPITMEPIRKQTATITSCGHIFQKEALREWMRSHDTCPECRNHCDPGLRG